MLLLEVDCEDELDELIELEDVDSELLELEDEILLEDVLSELELDELDVVIIVEEVVDCEELLVD